MKQQTLAMAGEFEAGFERYRRPLRRDARWVSCDHFRALGDAVWGSSALLPQWHGWATAHVGSPSVKDYFAPNTSRRRSSVQGRLGALGAVNSGHWPEPVVRPQGRRRLCRQHLIWLPLRRVSMGEPNVGLMTLTRRRSSGVGRLFSLHGW